MLGDAGDDNESTVALTMAYVGDCNSLMHQGDVLFFLTGFVQLATPLGAILNTEKTRILTTTTGKSLVERLLASKDTGLIKTGSALQSAIA
ncbi:hypothetical protein ACHAXN_001288 [Cyclotella atomus]